MIKIEVACVHCQNVYALMVEQSGFDNWSQGLQLIQNAMPYLTAGERELLISGTCDDCWDNMFNIGYGDDDTT